MFLRLFRGLLLVFLVGFVVRLILFALGRAARQTPQVSRPVGPERLVRDPVCGVRIPVSQAVAAAGQHFCSDACAKAMQAAS